MVACSTGHGILDSMPVHVWPFISLSGWPRSSECFVGACLYIGQDRSLFISCSWTIVALERLACLFVEPYLVRPNWSRGQGTENNCATSEVGWGFQNDPKCLRCHAQDCTVYMH